jgi:lipoprotein-releasing system permease protein
MVTLLLILILERTNFIGITKALGISNGQLQIIFSIQSIYITIVGMVIGNVIGLGGAYIQQRFGIFKLPEESYYISTVPIHFSWATIVWLNILVVVISIFVMLIPSLLVRRISAIKAIKFS